MCYKVFSRWNDRVLYRRYSNSTVAFFRNIFTIVVLYNPMDFCGTLIVSYIEQDERCGGVLVHYHGGKQTLLGSPNLSLYTLCWLFCAYMWPYKRQTIYWSFYCLIRGFWELLGLAPLGRPFSFGRHHLEQVLMRRRKSKWTTRGKH